MIWVDAGEDGRCSLSLSLSLFRSLAPSPSMSCGAVGSEARVSLLYDMLPHLPFGPSKWLRVHRALWLGHSQLTQYDVPLFLNNLHTKPTAVKTLTPNSLKSILGAMWR